MLEGSMVKFSGQDTHRLREPLTDEIGVVRHVAGNPDLIHGRREVYVEFHRDNHRPSNGWWLDPQLLRRV